MSGIGHNSAAYGEGLCEEVEGVLSDANKKLFHYVQWHLADYITGTQGMNPEQEGIYIRFLVRLYDRGKPFPDDDRFMASIMSLDVRRWRRVKCDLLSFGKITQRSGGLTNSRFEKERLKRAEELQKQADATNRYWEKRRAEKATSDESRGKVGQKSGQSPREVPAIIAEKPNEINETAQHPNQQTRDQRLETREKKERDNTAASVQEAARVPLDEIEGLNGATFLVHGKIARWLRPYEPDYRTAREWLTNTCQIFGGEAVRNAFAIIDAKIASGDVIGAPLKLMTAICREEKAKQDKAKAPPVEVRPDHIPPGVWAKLQADKAKAAMASP